MRVLIVPDKFKGTLTARQAAEAIALGWREARPQDELELLPMSDGGDGFGEVIGDLLGASLERSSALNAALEPVEAAWWWSEESGTAIVESARAVGLAMLPSGKFHPFELDTYGLGVLLQQIGQKHPHAKLIVGIGGSATNDGGFGMARALGFKFFDASGAELQRWTDLGRLVKIKTPAPPLWAGVTIATDVQNPLLGPNGASRIYGPQKGLKGDDFAVAEKCLETLARVVHRDLGVDAVNEPGTGAAGGLGYGLRVFLKGAFESGFEIFASHARLPAQIESSSLVLTGEGSIDRSTQMGKGTGAVAQLAQRLETPCIGLAGVAQERDGLFTEVHAIAPDLASAEQAMARAGDWLRALSRRTASQILPNAYI